MPLIQVQICVQGQPVLHSQFQDIQSYIVRPCLKKTNNKTKRKLLFPCGHFRERTAQKEHVTGRANACIVASRPSVWFSWVFVGAHRCHVFSFLALFLVQHFLLFCFLADSGLTVWSATLNNNINSCSNSPSINSQFWNLFLVYLNDILGNFF